MKKFGQNNLYIDYMMFKINLVIILTHKISRSFFVKKETNNSKHMEQIAWTGRKNGLVRRWAQFVTFKTSISAHWKWRLQVWTSLRRSKVEECSQNSQYLQLYLQPQSFSFVDHKKWRRNFIYSRDWPPRHFNLLLLPLPPLSAYWRSLSQLPFSALEEVLSLFSLLATRNR